MSSSIYVNALGLYFVYVGTYILKSLTDIKGKKVDFFLLFIIPTLCNLVCGSLQYQRLTSHSIVWVLTLSYYLSWIKVCHLITVDVFPSIYAAAYTELLLY